jgi:hypothetical protein
MLRCRRQLLYGGTESLRISQGNHLTRLGGLSADGSVPRSSLGEFALEQRGEGTKMGAQRAHLHGEAVVGTDYRNTPEFWRQAT